MSWMRRWYKDCVPRRMSDFGRTSICLITWHSSRLSLDLLHSSLSVLDHPPPPCAHRSPFFLPSHPPLSLQWQSAVMTALGLSEAMTTNDTLRHSQILCASGCFSSVFGAYMLIILQIWLPNALFNRLASPPMLCYGLSSQVSTLRCIYAHICAHICEVPYSSDFPTQYSND